MAALGLNNLIVVAPDVAKASEFYQNALGLTLSFIDGEKWAQMKAGPAKVGISSAEEAGAPDGTVVPVIEIDDVDAVRAAVIEHGGQVVGERDMGSHGYSLAIRDINGTMLQLIKR